MADRVSGVDIDPSPAHAIIAALAGNPVTVGAAACVLLLAGIAVFAPAIAPYDPLTQSVLHGNLPPSAEHWLGTDQFGRDVLSRVIYGARSSLLLGALSPLVAGAGGSLLGVTAGYFGGIVDRLAGRLIDLLLAFPALLLGILVAAALGPGFWELVAALAISFAPRFARIARASTLSVRTEPFVEAAVASGVRHPVIHRAAHRAQHRRPDRGRADAVGGDRHSPGGDAELPRPRHTGAAAELGQHHP